MTRLRKALRATVVVQCFNWASLLLSLVTVPLYLSWLGEERYGLFLTGVALAGYLMFSDAGITWASMLLIAEANGKDDRPGVATVFRTSFPFALLSSLLVAVVVAGTFLILSRPEVKAAWSDHPEFPGLLLAVGATVVTSLIFSPFYNLFIGLQETSLAAIYQGSGRLIAALATLALAGCGLPLGWVYCGNVAGLLLTGILAAIHCRRRHRWAFAKGALWDRGQVKRQFHTGVSSLLMQSGTVFLGSAPVLAASAGAGPQTVPYLAIPLTLLNAPLGIVSTFSANLQSGYGEAMGRGESRWVAETVNLLLRGVFLILAWLGCGWFLLAGAFVEQWTQGRLGLTLVMVLNAFLIAGAGAVITTMRYGLTGINRHGRAALAECLGGLLALAGGILVVRLFGFAWVGTAIFLSMVLVTGWLYPRELKRALGGGAVFPKARFWIALLATTSLAASAGVAVKWAMTSLPVWSMILVTGTVVTAVFFGLAHRWLPDEMEFATRRLFARWRRSAAPLPPDAAT